MNVMLAWHAAFEGCPLSHSTSWQQAEQTDGMG